MDSNSENGGSLTPAKDPKSNRLKISENSNPNITSPGLKLCKSPAIKSATKSQKSTLKNPNPKIASPSQRNQIRERRFVVAKKNLKKENINPSAVVCKCKDRVGGKSQKCLCVAYENLRASQEDFFKNRGGTDDRFESEHLKNSERAETLVELEEEKPVIQNPKIANGCEGESKEVGCSATNGLDDCDPDETEQSGETGNSTIKRRRDKLLEEARENVPEPGSGRVMHLVKAFEKLLTIPISKDSDQKDEKQLEDRKKAMEWALPGLQPRVPETQVSSSSFCPSDFFLTSESLGLSASLDSSQASFNTSNRTSAGGRRSRRNSSESSGTFAGRRWKRRQLKATCQQPFKLRTEQRGRNKEEEFIKKVEQMLMEEEKQRIPIAQGLPWTTDEPECLVKPPIKEHTRPIDLKLHSDLRAVERAEFDHQVAEKMSLIEQYRLEMERQQKLAEEEEIRRLRKELIPRAQPMPYFDRPFIPRRSQKNPTMPREPKFHVPQHKKIKCCMSWNDMYAQYQ
ncbi:microtubule-destabilizing protein 60-like [Cornus florida]|uniref:microtubule-destabilizing protein 60-like n=1 Tax=Cornus florida TaxID=4283 RepID=UPI0028A1CA0A|nr:microtubule-destabilizing protein 60-like [Cornus florida]